MDSEQGNEGGGSEGTGVGGQRCGLPVPGCHASGVSAQPLRPCVPVCSAGRKLQPPDKLPPGALNAAECQLGGEVSLPQGRGKPSGRCQTLSHESDKCSCISGRCQTLRCVFPVTADSTVQMNYLTKDKFKSWKDTKVPS